MTDINAIVLSGRAVTDAEPRMAGQSELLVLPIAVKKSRKDTHGNWVDEVSYFDVVIWSPNKTAKEIKKGDRIMVQGELQQERWEKDGEKRSKVTILCNRIIVGIIIEQKTQQVVNTPATAPAKFKYVIDDMPF